jgi:hypothetical protein
MKTINKGELFQNLSGFLKKKGIELKDGSYSRRIEQGCGLLADVVNTTQRAAKRARSEVNRKFSQLRQSIHEATAPQTAKGKPSVGRANSKAKTASRKTAGSRVKSRSRK